MSGDKHKMISGNLAKQLTEIAGHLADLNNEIKEMQWSICYDDAPIGYTHAARKHCRRLLAALAMIDHLIRYNRPVVTYVITEKVEP